MSAVAKIQVSIASRAQDGRSGADDLVELIEGLDRFTPSFEIVLDSDAPVAVALNGMAEVSLVKLEAIGGKVRARLTSTDGAAQAVPVDPIALVVSRSVPFTAIDLTRVAGGPTVRVRVALGAPST